MSAPVVAIDPGFAARGPGCAVALFDDTGRLVEARYARPETVSPVELLASELYTDMATAPQPLAVVWESPQVDARTRVSTPAVVRLAAVGGVLAGLYAGANGGKVEAVTPSIWKGTAPKPVHHSRMWRALTAAEQRLLGGEDTLTRIHAARRAGAKDRWGKPGGAYYPTSWWTHNLLDAVGIGLWRLGRGQCT